MARLIQLARGITVETASRVVRLDGKPLRVIYGGIGWRRVVQCLIDAKSCRFVFTGGTDGVHSIAADGNITSAARLLAHWRGYVETTDLKLAVSQP